MSRKALFANLKAGSSEGSEAERAASIDDVGSAENIGVDPLESCASTCAPNSRCT